MAINSHSKTINGNYDHHDLREGWLCAVWCGGSVTCLVFVMLILLGSAHAARKIDKMSFLTMVVRGLPMFPIRAKNGAIDCRDSETLVSMFLIVFCWGRTMEKRVSGGCN